MQLRSLMFVQLIVACFCLAHGSAPDERGAADPDGSNKKDPTASSEAVDAPEVPASAPGLVRDLLLIRKTQKRPQQPPVHVTSAEAFGAITRIRDRINFIGMTRETVLWALGDPATVCDYGIKATAGENDPLVYRFSNGITGMDYTFEFEDGKVKEVKARGTY